MKKTLSILLCLILCITCLAGCGGKEKKQSLAERQANSDTLLSDEELSYVLIYNPNIYDETMMSNELLTTGQISNYVEAVVNRADGLEPEIPEFVPRSIKESTDAVDFTGFDLSGDRADMFIAPYEVGDTQMFYFGSDSRYQGTFLCKYAGESCNVWTINDSLSDAQAQDAGAEFDNNIYNQVTEMFGKSRFAENGGKVNLLFYPMDGGTLGFFAPFDLFASYETTDDEKMMYGLNADHDILNINSLAIDYKDLTYSTMAHEFQHLICFTSYFETVNYTQMRTWLNEAMSGYVEETLYPGAKDASGHYDAFVTSNRIRHGQSMYNFDTTMTSYDFDIGVYGSVYLFSEYLADIAGDDIFSNIHDYWRTSYSYTLDEAEAIKESVGTSVYEEINSFIDYAGVVNFNNENEEWLSKLTLKFYLSLLNPTNDSPEAFEKIQSQTLLYDEINPADIEGGGRVIAALKNGEFKFPEDADKNLVYVGLNENFEVVTEYVIR